MAHSVRKHLRLDIEEYDETIRRFIPGYDEMLSVAADAVAAIEPELVVDLGGGTGGLSEALLSRGRISTVELLDVDPEMMEQARQRLAPFEGRVRFTLGSYHDALPRCDAFVASLSLHHIRSLEAKEAFYSRVFDGLRGGGALVNADVNVPADGEERDRIYRFWTDHLRSRGIGEDQARQHFEEWAEEDTYFPLEDEISVLERVGFGAQRVWDEGPMGVVVATKPKLG